MGAEPDHPSLLIAALKVSAPNTVADFCAALRTTMGEVSSGRPVQARRVDLLEWNARKRIGVESCDAPGRTREGVTTRNPLQIPGQDASSP